ncbi:MAG TPA: HXXEE domain-containing protein [Candidatus Paceibacterota bacterium]
MIPQRLKNIFFLSIPVFVAHGLEEYFTGFYSIDPYTDLVFGNLNVMPTPQAVFLIFQMMLWLLLIVSAFLITSEKWQMRLMLIPGLVYIFEIHHIWKAIEAGGYYPGLVTSLAFPIIAVVFWKELLKNRSHLSR